MFWIPVLKQFIVAFVIFCLLVRILALEHFFQIRIEKSLCVESANVIAFINDWHRFPNLLNILQNDDEILVLVSFKHLFSGFFSEHLERKQVDFVGVDFKLDDRLDLVD